MFVYWTELGHVGDSTHQKRICYVFAFEDAIQVECLQDQEADTVLINGIVTRSVALGY